MISILVSLGLGQSPPFPEGTALEGPGFTWGAQC